MNVANILTLTTYLETEVKPHSFSMASWIHGWGLELLHRTRTAVCIGRWAEALFTEFKNARLALGLTSDQADELFYVLDLPIPLREITKDQAVHVLRHLAQTGEVKWEISE